MPFFAKPYLYLFAFAALQCLPNIVKGEEQDSTSKQAITVPAPVPLNQQYKADLTHYLPENQVKPMLVGSEEFITLITESRSANNKGVAILIPDWQQGATNPKAINFLRNRLPQQGWTTISVQPESMPANYPSTALEIAEQTTANQASLTNYKSLFSAMVNAVMNKASEYSGIVIIVAQGNNGAMLINSLGQNGNKNSVAPNAIILLSSYVFTGEKLLTAENTAFAKALANSEIPVLDLYLQHDNAIVTNSAPQRLTYAKQAMKVYYRQQQLNNSATGFYPQQALLDQINRWLTVIGW